MAFSIEKGDDPIDHELVIINPLGEYHIFKSFLLGENDFIETTLKKYGYHDECNDVNVISMIKIQYNNQCETFGNFSSELQTKIKKMFSINL
jgi:hypothetical protein